MRGWVDAGAKQCYTKDIRQCPLNHYTPSISSLMPQQLFFSCYVVLIISKACCAEIRSDGLNSINPSITGRSGWSISSWIFCLNLYSSPRSTRRSPSVVILLLATVYVTKQE